MSPPNSPQRITVDQLLQRFEVLLLDAYGVLIHHGGPLPGGKELIQRLNREGKDYFILTNDASRLPQTSARQMEAMGLEVDVARIISSGSLLGPYFAQQNLKGAQCVVLGPDDSCQMVQQAGGELVQPGEDLDVLVVCDEVGFNFVDTVDAVLSTLIRRLDRGNQVRLVLPNPDLIYPKTDSGYGITAGSLALLLEGALEQRYPARDDLRFERLGKPNQPIFQAALARSGVSPRELVMVGDQPGTDIRGANTAGIASCLVPTGLNNRAAADLPAAERPTYLLPSLEL